VECVWGGLKDCWLQAADEVCGRTKGPPRHKESWWWNDEIDALVIAKRRCLREMKRSNTIANLAAYCNVKMETKRTIAIAQAAERKRFTDMLEPRTKKGTSSEWQSSWEGEIGTLCRRHMCEGREWECYFGGR